MKIKLWMMLVGPETPSHATAMAEKEVAWPFAPHPQMLIEDPMWTEGRRIVYVALRTDEPDRATVQLQDAVFKSSAEVRDHVKYYRDGGWAVKEYGEAKPR